MLNERGHEVLDPTPKAITVPFRRPEPLHLRIRRMIIEAQREAGQEYESFEDADDFAIGDPSDYEDRLTPYEEHFMPKPETTPSPADKVPQENQPDTPPADLAKSEAGG